jgi:hypothetical protein
MTSQLDSQIRGLMQRVVDEAPPPPESPMQAPFVPTRVVRRTPAWVVAAGTAIVVLLAVGAVALWSGDGDDVVDLPAPTVVSEPVAPSDSVSLSWSLESRYDGFVFPVAFDMGFASLHRLDVAAAAEVWVSDDGVAWSPARAQPPGELWDLTTDGTVLFVEGDGVWSSVDGVEWQPTSAPDALLDIDVDTVQHDGITLIRQTDGLWAMEDGSARRRVAFGGHSNYIEAMAAGDLGWFVFEMDEVQQRLWYSIDTLTWTRIEGIGPLGVHATDPGPVSLLTATLLVGERSVLVYAVHGEPGGFGWIGNPVTEVWSATLTVP